MATPLPPTCLELLGKDYTRGEGKSIGDRDLLSLRPSAECGLGSKSRITPHKSGDLNWWMQHFTRKEKVKCMRKKQKRKRRGFTATELAEVWDRWQRGESSKLIARVLGRGSSVYSVLLRHGGIRPRPRLRSRLALRLAEREEMSRGVAAKQSIRSIAVLLGRSPSTVSREICRNGGYDKYRASTADE